MSGLEGHVYALGLAAAAWWGLFVLACLVVSLLMAATAELLRQFSRVLQWRARRRFTREALAEAKAAQQGSAVARPLHNIPSQRMRESEVDLAVERLVRSTGRDVRAAGGQRRTPRGYR